MGLKEDVLALEIKLELLGREAKVLASDAWTHVASAFKKVKDKVVTYVSTAEGPQKSGFAWMPLIGLLCTALPYLIELLKNRLGTKASISDDDKIKVGKIRGCGEALGPVCDQLNISSIPYDPSAAVEEPDVPLFESFGEPCPIVCRSEGSPEDDMRVKLVSLLGRVSNAPRMFVGANEKKLAAACMDAIMGTERITPVDDAAIRVIISAYEGS